LKLRVAVCALLFPSIAYADGDTQAEDLFQKAKGLMQSGKWADACPLLAESYRLDPAGGTLQNLAVCYETTQKWASAYARFNELKVAAKKSTPPRNDRVKLADEHLAKVTPHVSHVIVTMPEDVAGTAVVEIETVKYERVSWSAGIAIDPGPHDVTVTAIDHKPYKTTVTVPNDGTEMKVQVPALEAIPVAPTPLIADDRHTDDEKAEKERVRAADSARRMGYFIGGAGLVLGAGAITFGVLTIAKNNAGKDLCDQTTNDLQHQGGHCIVQSNALTDANSDKSKARAFAVVSDILGAASIVGLAAGAYFVFVRGHVAVAPTVGGATMFGVF
jgi:hypothetical protein